MPLPLNAVPEGDFESFLGAPTAPDLDALDADFAVIGIPFGVPYGIAGVASDASRAPRAVRARSVRFGRLLDHYDFDFDGALFDGRGVRLVDCGDVPADPRDLAANAARATEAIRTIRARGAVPLVLGGDDSIPPLVLRAYRGSGPLHVLQIDAHLDFRDEVDGIGDGYSSPMRRASEMDWVARIVHVGLRGVGSARAQDVADSREAGNALITARMVREGGVGRVLEEFPAGAEYFITLDCDGLDPSVAPGTSAPMPGGLSFDAAAELLRGLARRGRVVGMDVTEHFPSLDLHGITSLAITRLIVNLMGEMIRSGS
ncbi:MAG: agmatinase [Alphaproteobacteria bacterium]